jgi:hypothetical protein
VSNCGSKWKAAVTASCLWWIAVSPNAVAQNRFDVISDDVIAAVSGMTVYTIRDNISAVCYTLFVVEPSDAGPAPIVDPVPVLTAEQLAKVRVADTLKDAMAARDRHLADLRSRATMLWTVEYQAAHERIVEGYERAVRGVLPDLFPAAQVAPAWRTTSTEQLNEAVRRAIADADVAIASASRLARDEQLRRLLDRATQSAKLTVSGPVGCNSR